MSKKHYIAIAKIIREAAEVPMSESRQFIANELADLLKKDNPHFDRDKFIQACDPFWR